MINYCLISWWLAYAMAIYCTASLYYYIKTRDIGTPFKDSLTKKQIKIKEESTKIRKRIFYEGLMGVLAIVLIFRPFSSC